MINSLSPEEEARRWSQHLAEDRSIYKNLKLEDLQPHHDLQYCEFLSTRLRNCLRQEGIYTLNDVCQYTVNDFLNIRNFGHGTIEELDKILRQCGLNWAEPRSKTLEKLTDAELLAECKKRGLIK